MSLYLSRLCLPAAYPLYRLHQIVYSGCPDTRAGRVLYRWEPGNVVLVQTDAAPDWQRLPPGSAAETRPLSVGYAAGTRLRFCLVANPTYRDNDRRTRHALETEPDWRFWLDRQFWRAGVTPEAYTCQDLGTEQDRHITLRRVRFAGTLTVQDPAALAAAVAAGIGPAKGFGCGLLSLREAGVTIHHKGEMTR